MLGRYFQLTYQFVMSIWYLVATLKTTQLKFGTLTQVSRLNY